MKKKAAIYDPYLDTLGGGERYCLSVAEFLISQGYQVDIFWSGDRSLLDKAQNRFNLDLSSLNIVDDIFHSKPNKIDFVEDVEDVIKIAKPHASINHSYFFKLKNIFQKISVTRQYDVFFYLSDWSIPFLFSKNNLLHIQVPFLMELSLSTKLINYLKLLFFKKVICNSSFTLKFAQNNFGNKCCVLYPPVDVEKFTSSEHKENIILSVGRFDNILNSKKQDLMIDAFIKLFRQNSSFNWKLILAGGSLQNPDKNSYFQHLQTQAKGFPIEFLVNPDFITLQKTYSLSKIYWHAAGFNVDEELHPENTEHFGIAPVEAMASGAVPVTVAKGGLPEIIDDGLNGYLWSTVNELITKTNLLISSPKNLSTMSQLARKKSVEFSKEKFYAHLKKFL